jgi:hypothetical protein
LNPKKVHLGLTTIIFVGHEIDAEDINMSQKRVESTIDVLQPSNLNGDSSLTEDSLGPDPGHVSGP